MTAAAVRVPVYGPPGELILAALVDHLYPGCPLLRRQCRGQEPQQLTGVLSLIVNGEAHPDFPEDALVDPEGSYLCGWCQRVWRARNRRAAAEVAGDGA